MVEMSSSVFVSPRGQPRLNVNFISAGLSSLSRGGRKKERRGERKLVFSQNCLNGLPQTILTPLWKDETRDGMLPFALRPPQVYWDSSEVGTADLPSSVCSVQTVWATQ